MHRPRRVLVLSAVFVAIGICAALVWFARSREKPPQTVKLQVVEPVVVATLKDQFRCTLYYTPLETGFSDAGGFNMKSETRIGLNGREFPHDFLAAVEKEG